MTDNIRKYFGDKVMTLADEVCDTPQDITEFADSVTAELTAALTHRDKILHVRISVSDQPFKKE